MDIERERERQGVVERERVNKLQMNWPLSSPSSCSQDSVVLYSSPVFSV